MVIFVHIASVWVPFTSESKEAIAEYDEIVKEITLALRECGRRLGLFLRRRERAASEYRRRNIFELYIEEVVEACNRLKGGKLPTEKLKAQLQRIASSRTGGLKTDETLGKTGAGPEGLPHSIIVTAEGIEGNIPPTLDVSRTFAPVTDASDGMRIEERKPASKPEHNRTTKTRPAKKPLGEAVPVPSISEKKSSRQQQTGAVRTSRKARRIHKKL
jgi:DNA topoisomerase-6 subunit B